MSQSQKFRAQPREYAAQALAANDLHEAVRLRNLAKADLLLERNAKWIESTDEFLDTVKTRPCTH
jgi:hypothetical protein